MSHSQEGRRLEVIATLALGEPAGPRVDLSVKARSGRLHFGEWLLISIQQVSVFLDTQEAPITVFKGGRSLDLFSNKTTPQFLGSSPAPEGRVSRIKLSLSRVALWVARDKVLPVSCSVGEGDAIELAPSKPLQAREREVLSLALIFDTELSLVRHEPLLRIAPVIHLKRILEK